MKGYVVVQETITYQQTFDSYRKDVPATLEAFGGRFIVRGGQLSISEGEWAHPRFVVIEFPSRSAAESWYDSPDYQKLVPLRLKSAAGNLVIVDGIA